MTKLAVLLLIAVLGPVVAFGTAFLLFRAIRLSGTPRGAQLLALGTAGGIQGAILAAAIASYGFGKETILTLVASTLMTGMGWVRFQRAFPVSGGPRRGST